MPLTPPSNITYGKVVLEGIYDDPDGIDADVYPDFFGASGTITFTRSVSKLLDAGASPNPITVYSDIYVGILDSSGYLCVPDPGDPTPWAPTIPGARGMWVIASDCAALNPVGATYTVTYSLTGRNGRALQINTHSIYVKTYVNPGDECDLTRDAPVDSSTGVPTTRGLQGLTGPKGSQWFSGHGAPGTVAGAVLNDQYIDLDTANIYTLGVSAWTLTGTLVLPSVTDSAVAALIPATSTAAALNGRYVAGKVVTTSSGPNVQLGSTGTAIASDVLTAVMLNPGSAAYNNVIGGTDITTVGTVTPNVSATGSGANVAVVGGYDNMACALSSKIIADHSYVGPDAVGGHNAIYGGATHAIHGAAAKFSMIAGGQQNDIQSQYSHATGFLNAISGGGSARVSGDHNTVSATGATADGSTNTVSGTYARAHGSTNTASGSYSSAEGQKAYARRYGQHAYASGQVNTLGDAQTSFHTVFGVTTNATPQTLGVDGGTTYNSNHQMIPGSTVMVTATVVGRTAGGTVHAGYVIKGLAHQETAGNGLLIGVPAVEDFNPSSGCAATIIAALSVGQLAVQVTGIAATTIQWSAKIDLVEVVLP